ncbi:MAG TPA: FlgD immunoglobulin-like domain containing protein [Candidatus Eisenbacteria bacterium]|nr:FlgD immunoglobulin-like domain containing protein [Candidatus Eisenbacteria bacterium]
MFETSGGALHVFEVIDLDPMGIEQRICLPNLPGTFVLDLPDESTTYTWTALTEQCDEELGPLDDDNTPNRFEIVVRVLNNPQMHSPVLEINIPSGGDDDPWHEGARARQVRPEGEVAGSATPSAVTLHVLRDMPLGTGVNLRVGLPAETQARVDLFDITGRRLRTLSNGVMSSGETVLWWDGRDDAGRNAPAGVVFARLSTPREARTARFLAGIR